MNAFSFKITLAQLMLFVACVGGHKRHCKADDNEPWSYRGKGNGPGMWGKTFPDCSKTMQSPIDIRFDDVKEDENVKPLHFQNYNKEVTSAQVINNGHTVVITPSDGVVRSIFVNGEAYNLAQMHFHWGSHHNVGTEHLFNSKRYAMEVHIVHKNSRGALAAVGVLCKYARSDNTAFKPIVEVLSQIKFENDTTQLRSPLHLAKLLPFMPLPFFRYNGSLTAPNCTEGVIWSVAQDFLQIGSNQLKKLRSLYSVPRNEDRAGCHLKDNCRPVQPLNGRTVIMSSSDGAQDILL